MMPDMGMLGQEPLTGFKASICNSLSQLVLQYLTSCWLDCFPDMAVAAAQQAALGSDRSGVASEAVSSAAEAVAMAEASHRAVRGLTALITTGVAHRQVTDCLVRHPCMHVPTVFGMLVYQTLDGSMYAGDRKPGGKR